MKKITYTIVTLFFLLSVFSCSGYKPIFNTADLRFKIADYSLKGDKKLGNQIYSKLNNISRTTKNTADKKDIHILIDVSKNKEGTSKDSTGKILTYRIRILTKVIIKDYLSDNEILNENFNLSSSYEVQDQYSETINAENKSIEDLINKIFQDLLIKLSEKIS